MSSPPPPNETPNPPSGPSPPRRPTLRQRQLSSLGEERPPGFEPRPAGKVPRKDRDQDRGRQPEKERPRPRPAPSVVSWPDHASHPSQYTFYREGTPTPPEYDEEKHVGPWPLAMGSRNGVSAASAAVTARETARSITPQERRYGNKTTICGLRRKLFWIVVSLVLLAVAVAVGVGVRVGVGLGAERRKKDGAAVDDGSGSTRANSPTRTPIASPTRTQASSTTTPTTTTQSSCPFGNNTIYHVPGSDKRFLRLCGIDYGGETYDGAIDMKNLPTGSFAECMDNCAGTIGCTGCGWGSIKGDTGKEHRCWLKMALTKSHKADDGWCFGMLQ